MFCFDFDLLLLWCYYKQYYFLILFLSDIYCHSDFFLVFMKLYLFSTYLPDTLRGQKRVSDPPELAAMWVLGRESRSSGRTATTLQPQSLCSYYVMFFVAYWSLFKLVFLGENSTFLAFLVLIAPALHYPSYTELSGLHVEFSSRIL